MTQLESERTLEQTYNALGNRLQHRRLLAAPLDAAIYPAYHLEADYLNGPPVQRRGHGAADARAATTTLDHCLVWLSYLEEVFTWDHRNNPLEPQQRLLPQPVAAAGGRAAAGRLHLLARAARRARLRQLRRRRRADARGAAAGRGPLAAVGQPRRQRGGHPLLRRRRRLDARLQRAPAVAAAAGPARPSDPSVAHHRPDRRQRHDRGQLRGALLDHPVAARWPRSSTSAR